MNALKITPGVNGKRVIIQGLGNVGFHAAKYLQKQGKAIIVGIAEKEGGIFNPDGLDVEAVFKHLSEVRSIHNFPGATNVATPGEMLEMDCDILVPAALENQITVDNAARIKAKIIAEAANGPVTFGADEILRKRGVFIIPDLYLNAGGVTVSYFEWLKNLSHVSFGRMNAKHEEIRSKAFVNSLERMVGKFFDPNDRQLLIDVHTEKGYVFEALEDTMAYSYTMIRDCWKSRSLPDLRTAAFYLAIDRVGQSYLTLGVFP